MNIDDRKVFAPIEGLRAYLALWVAIGHGLETSGVMRLPGPLQLLMRPEQAVNVFMIVSGFVITHLLTKSSESYAQYITRRFFRLYPLFVVGCICGYLVLGLWVPLVRDVPWADSDGWSQYASGVFAVVAESTRNTVPHLLLHAVMLHGLLPVDFLPEASKTFLPAAWSISLEWQFYLVAPFVLRWSRKPLPIVVAAATFAVAAWLYRRGLLGEYSGTSTLLSASGFFAVGIVSRLGFFSLRQVIESASTPWKISVVFLFLLFFFASQQLALLLWAPFYFYLMSPKENVVHRTIGWLTTNRAALAIGTISYSLYLANRPIEVLLGYLALRLEPQISRPVMFASQIVATGISLVCAYYLWKWIEVPGQRLGKWLIQRYLQPRSGALAH